MELVVLYLKGSLPLCLLKGIVGRNCRWMDTGSKTPNVIYAAGSGNPLNPCLTASTFWETLRGIGVAYFFQYFYACVALMKIRLRDVLQQKDAERQGGA